MPEGAKRNSKCEHSTEAQHDDNKDKYKKKCNTEYTYWNLNSPLIDD